MKFSAAISEAFLIFPCRGLSSLPCRALLPCVCRLNSVPSQQSAKCKWVSVRLLRIRTQVWVGATPEPWKEQAVLWGVFAGMWGQGHQADLSASPYARLAASAAKGGAAPPSLQTGCHKCTRSFLLSALTAHSSSLHSFHTRMKSHGGAEASRIWQRISFPWK